MKLGSETGSVMNHLHSRATIGQPTPEVGMGVTFLGWTDRHPGTIVQVYSKDDAIVGFVAQGDEAIRTDRNGMSEDQAYEFVRNPNAPMKMYRLDRNGQWRRSERNLATGKWRFLDKSQSIRLGERDKYHDYSF